MRYGGKESDRVGNGQAKDCPDDAAAERNEYRLYQELEFYFAIGGPSALRIPISRIRERTFASMMFMIPIPPTARLWTIPTAGQASAHWRSAQRHAAVQSKSVHRTPSWSVPGADHLQDLFGRQLHIPGVANRKENLLDVIGPGKVARDRVRDKDGLIGHLRLSEGSTASLKVPMTVKGMPLISNF